MTTIFEALENAEFNLCEGKTEINQAIGKEQLHNAVALLEKGYDIDDEMDDILAQYPSVEDVPDKN